LTHKFTFLLLAFFIILAVSNNQILTGAGANNLEGITAYDQARQININFKDTVKIHEIETKKVHVGDIDIAYKMFGIGSPVLLINGLSAPLDFWDPVFLERVSSNHTVVVFDNRGIGNTTSGEKMFTVKQFADDTAGLLDALKIKKAEVIGWSMGGMIAQELALEYPDKIRKIVIYASTCGGKESILPSMQVMKAFTDQFGTQSERLQKFLPLLFPEKWRTQNPDYLENIPTSMEKISDLTISQQRDAIINWPGTCNYLDKISQETLVIVGTDDILTVPANSLLISNKIPGAALVEIQGGGHALMMQYPEHFSNLVLAFLEN